MTVSELDATLSAAPQLDEPSDEQPTGDERTRIPASSPFNPWRIAATKKAKAIVHEAVEAVEAVEERQKKRRAVDQDTFERAVEAVLCDLMHHHLYQRPGDGIYVSRSKQVLTAKPRYRPPVYTKTFRDILDNLDRAEWIVQEVGEQGRGGTGKRTVVLMSRLLFDKMTSAGITGEDIGSDDRSEVIILKRSKNPDNFWDEGEEIEYRDTEVTAVLRDQMQRINCWLKTADIELDRTWITAPNVGSSDERTLRRIFTNGSFTSGGRLYGGFWQTIRANERAGSVFIDGENVAELDYGQMGLRILYGHAGTDPGQDDLYDIPILNIPASGGLRKGIKQVLNAMISASKPLDRFPKGTRQFFLKGISISTVTAAIEDRHAAIRHLFYTGFGHRVQFTESQITVDLLLRLMGEGITALQLHDAVLVAKSKADRTETIMLETFKDHVGIPGQVSR
ncbi:hypothetical protein [Brucella sp. 6810]|uniref:hypothetical protein n=1 Tax=Brucella sp. 6810 TaxID=2769351 RepID=UPI001FFE4BE4|nr:hypothetical protein [Brucella sp. 6810]